MFMLSFDERQKNFAKKGLLEDSVGTLIWSDPKRSNYTKSYNQNDKC